MSKAEYETIDHRMVEVEMGSVNAKNSSGRLPEKYSPIEPKNAPVSLAWSDLNISINVFNYLLLLL